MAEYEWVTGVITPISGATNPCITGCRAQLVEMVDLSIATLTKG